MAMSRAGKCGGGKFLPHYLTFHSPNLLTHELLEIDLAANEPAPCGAVVCGYGICRNANGYVQ